MFAQRFDKSFPTNVCDHDTQMQYFHSQQASSQGSSCNDPDGIHRYSTTTPQNSTTCSGQAALNMEPARADVSPNSPKRPASCTALVGGNDDLHQVWSSSATSPSSPTSSAYSVEGGSRSIHSSLPREDAASHLLEASPILLYDENLRQPCLQDYLTPTRGLGLVDLIPSSSPPARTCSQVPTFYLNNYSTTAQPYTPSEYIYTINKGDLAERNITQCHVACTGSIEGCHEDFAPSGGLDLRPVCYAAPRSHSTETPPVGPAYHHQHPTERLTALYGTPLQRTLRAPMATPHLLQAPFTFVPKSDCSFVLGSTGTPYDNEPASVGHANHLEDVFLGSIYTSSPNGMTVSQGAPCLGLQQPWPSPTATPHLLQAPFSFSPASDCLPAVGAITAPCDYEPTSVGYVTNPQELYRAPFSTSSSEEATLSKGAPCPDFASPRHRRGDCGHPFISDKYAESGYIAPTALHHPRISHDPPTPTSCTSPFHQPTPSIDVSALAASISHQHLSEPEEVSEEHAGTHMSATGTRRHHSFELHKAAPRQDSSSFMGSPDGPGQEELSQRRSGGVDFSLRPRLGNHSYNLRGLTAPCSSIHAHISDSRPLTDCKCGYLKTDADKKDEGSYQDARAETALLAAIGTTRKGPAPALRDLTLRRSTSAHVTVPGSRSRLHSCDFEGCNRIFTRLEHKRRHERSHTQEKPFACDVPGCGRFFSRSDNLAQHKRTHTKDGRTKRVTNANLSSAANHKR